MKLIVGLGNPGSEFEQTRHNIGFRVLDHLAERHAIRWVKKDLAQAGEKKIAGEPALFAKPQTFMNRSGAAVVRLLRANNLSPSDLVVVYDDLDLDLGRIRIRKRGSSGGHKGLESIIEALDADNFLRVRLGIGREQRGDAAEYVLKPFRSSERPIVESVVARAAEALERIVAGEVTQAMNEYNRDE